MKTTRVELKSPFEIDLEKDFLINPISLKVKGKAKDGIYEYPKLTNPKEINMVVTIKDNKVIKAYKFDEKGKKVKIK